MFRPPTIISHVHSSLYCMQIEPCIPQGTCSQWYCSYSIAHGMVKRYSGSPPTTTKKTQITYSHNLWRSVEPSCGGGKHVAMFGRSVVMLIGVRPISLLTVLLVVGRPRHIQLIPLHQRSGSHRCATERMFLNTLEPGQSQLT